jgi:hypothetical protein
LRNTKQAPLQLTLADRWSLSSYPPSRSHMSVMLRQKRLNWTLVPKTHLGTGHQLVASVVFMGPRLLLCRCLALTRH